MSSVRLEILPRIVIKKGTRYFVPFLSCVCRKGMHRPRSYISRFAFAPSGSPDLLVDDEVVL